MTQASNAIHAGADAVVARPPLVPLAEGAIPIMVTLRLSAKDAVDFARHLRKVIPVTRVASGCRYSHSYQAPNAQHEFVLIQGWDSVAQQQAYLAWRTAIGDMAHFVSLLSKPPVVEVFNLIDA